jgi:hypothetical protein
MCLKHMILGTFWENRERSRFRSLLQEYNLKFREKSFLTYKYFFLKSYHNLILKEVRSLFV